MCSDMPTCFKIKSLNKNKNCLNVEKSYYLIHVKIIFYRSNYESIQKMCSFILTLAWGNKVEWWRESFKLEPLPDSKLSLYLWLLRPARLITEKNRLKSILVLILNRTPLQEEDKAVCSDVPSESEKPNSLQEWPSYETNKEGFIWWEFQGSNFTVYNHVILMANKTQCEISLKYLDIFMFIGFYQILNEET